MLQAGVSMATFQEDSSMQLSLTTADFFMCFV